MQLSTLEVTKVIFLSRNGETFTKCIKSFCIAPDLCLVLFVSGIVSGIVISAIGICKTSIAGSLLMTVGMVTSAFVTDPHLLYVTYGLTAGVYIYLP